jgi:predicted ATPase
MGHLADPEVRAGTAGLEVVMGPVIRTLILKRFRSIPGDAVELDNPTFFVGRNGSGKSNLGDAFAFLSEAMSSPLHAVFDRRGGIAAVRNRSPVRNYPPNLGLGVKLGNLGDEVTAAHYAFEVKAQKGRGFEVVREQCVVHTGAGVSWFDRDRRGFRSNAAGLKPALEPASLGLPVVGGEASFAPVLRTLAGMRAYSIQPSRLREMQDPDSGGGLRPDGSNAASVLQEIGRARRDDVVRIGELLESIVPNTTSVRPIKHGNKLSLEFTQQWGEKKRLRFEAFNVSDGTLRALGLLVAVFQRPTPSLLVLEEPEVTIHPGALASILDLIRHAARSTQVVVTTHSPDVLDADWLEDRHLRIVDWTEGATHVRPVSKATREVMQEHLETAGGLLRSNALWEERDGSAETADLFEDVAA